MINRHAAEHMVGQRLTQGLTRAAVIAAYDPRRPATMRTAAVAALIGNLVNMKFGRKDELESDRVGVAYMSEAGYNPEALTGVMEVLAAAGGRGRAEVFSTHLNPENRVANIRRAIGEYGRRTPTMVKRITVTKGGDRRKGDVRPSIASYYSVCHPVGSFAEHLAEQ